MWKNTEKMRGEKESVDKSGRNKYTKCTNSDNTLVELWTDICMCVTIWRNPYKRMCGSCISIIYFYKEAGM